MKRFAFAIMLAGALVIFSGALAMAGGGAASKTEKAAVSFDEPTKLLGVILKGEYLFVHDDERMARGEDCTYVYNYANGKQGDLVVSFHCIPVPRQKANQFTVTVTMVPGTSLYELVEYRFAGSEEGHRVPAGK
jgi:hypothetical protein